MEYSDPRLRKKALDFARGVLTNQKQVADTLRGRIEKAKGVGADNPDNKWHKDYLKLVADLRRVNGYIETYTDKVIKLESD